MIRRAAFSWEYLFYLAVLRDARRGNQSREQKRAGFLLSRPRGAIAFMLEFFAHAWTIGRVDMYKASLSHDLIFHSLHANVKCLDDKYRIFTPAREGYISRLLCSYRAREPSKDSGQRWLRCEIEEQKHPDQTQRHVQTVKVVVAFDMRPSHIRFAHPASTISKVSNSLSPTHLPKPRPEKITKVQK